jgi:hypothetical protein
MDNIKKHLKKHDLYKAKADIKLKRFYSVEDDPPDIEMHRLYTEKSLRRLDINVIPLLKNRYLFEKVDKSKYKYYFDLYGNRVAFYPESGSDHIIYIGHKGEISGRTEFPGLLFKTKKAWNEYRLQYFNKQIKSRLQDERKLRKKLNKDKNNG